MSEQEAVKAPRISEHFLKFIQRFCRDKESCLRTIGTDIFKKVVHALQTNQRINDHINLAKLKQAQI